jgi:hypothetical protein
MRRLIITTLFAGGLLMSGLSMSPLVPQALAGHCGEKANDCNHSHNDNFPNCPGGSCKVVWIGTTGKLAP